MPQDEGPGAVDRGSARERLAARLGQGTARKAEEEEGVRETPPAQPAPDVARAAPATPRGQRDRPVEEEGSRETPPAQPAPDVARAAPATSRGLPDRPVAKAFGLGALAGIVLLGLVWVTVSALSDDPAASGQAGQAGQTGLLDQSRTTTSRPPGPTPVQRCASVAGALLQPLGAARPALDQWEVHVGAMNRLVVGAITLQQATAFWNQTRVGAKGRIADFHRADRVQRRLDITCPVHRVHSDGSPALRACVRQVGAERRALAAARTAVHTWEMHVANMERLRSGKLSPAAATTMWLSMWQQGVKELRVYHAAARQARHRDNCPVPVG